MTFPVKGNGRGGWLRRVLLILVAVLLLEHVQYLSGVVESREIDVYGSKQLQ